MSLAGHFGHVLGVDARGVGAGADLQVFLLGSGGILRRDEAVLLHAVDDVQLANAGALGIADRVVGRRGLGQPGEHGRLSDRNALKGLAEISLGRCCKTIGPVSEINLIHVDLENLVFGQQVLQFEG